MKTNRDYYLDGHGDNITFNCAHCPYDTRSEERIESHVLTHRPVARPEVPLMEIRAQRIRGTRVAICILSWNNENVIERVLDAAVHEGEILTRLGLEAKLVWVDNGSTDNTVIRGSHSIPFNSQHHLSSNMGQSFGRNSFIEYALDTDYIMMIDGDIIATMGSVWALVECLSSMADKVGCLGYYSPDCAPVEDKWTTNEINHIYPFQVRSEVKIAWTQYGLFRTSVFRDSMLRFDEEGPFLGPGWGLEDDDFWLQMAACGIHSYYVIGNRYIHSRGSSKLNLLNGKSVFHKRQDYVVSKWRGFKFPPGFHVDLNYYRTLKY